MPAPLRNSMCSVDLEQVFLRVRLYAAVYLLQKHPVSKDDIILNTRYLSFA